MGCLRTGAFTKFLFVLQWRGTKAWRAGSQESGDFLTPGAEGPGSVLCGLKK